MKHTLKILCISSLALSLAAHASNTVTTHSAPAPSVHSGGGGGFHPSTSHTVGAHPVAARPVFVRPSGATGAHPFSHRFVPQGRAYQPGGVFGAHRLYGSRGYHGTYVHVWHNWGGSFHYGPVFGVYLGYYDNPWFLGYPVYYQGYPIYPYAEEKKDSKVVPLEAAQSGFVCGDWQYGEKDHQFYWVPAPCPPPPPPPVAAATSASVNGTAQAPSPNAAPTPTGNPQ
jgi:hypothetical protein